MRVSSLVTEKIKIKIQLCQSAQRLTECVNVHSRATGPQGHTSWRALHLEKADCTTDLSNLYVRPTPLTCLVYTPNLMPNLLSLSLSLSLMANTHTHTLSKWCQHTHTLSNWWQTYMHTLSESDANLTLLITMASVTQTLTQHLPIFTPVGLWLS